MSLDPNDDILQDFLVEAGELLEQLNEQLVELEQSPEDPDLLNAVFRNFHTIKGGASFLGLDNLVDVCHKSEDVFNVLRNGERVADAALMDAVLRALDVVMAMFEQIRAGEMPDACDPALLEQLARFAEPAAAEASPGDAAEAEPEAAAEAEEASADTPPASDGDESEKGSEPPVGGDEITDEEFEALLDQLHGTGAPGASTASAATATSSDGSAASEGGKDEEITDEEFEALLDELYGKGAPPSPPRAAPAGTAVGEPKAGAATAGQASAAKKDEAAAPAAAQDKPKREEISRKAAGGQDRARGGGKTAPAGEVTVRVDTKRLDDIMNLVGELVLVRNRLTTLRADLANEEVAKAVSNLDVVTADLQTAVMKTRMQPIKKVFGRFPRVVRDLARSLNKEVTLELVGEETDLDKNLVEALADPLVHLVRNAVDHGIEPPEEREAAGKPRTGRVVLAAEQEGDHILLSITDDGRGMDADLLRRKAVEKGLMDEEAAARLDDREAYNLIFMPGFSTKEEISDVSGRGVGMDVVKTRIAQLNGSVEIDSTPGEGSRLSIRVPLTLAIMPTLMVVVGGNTFALPLSSVIEIFDMHLDQTNVVDGQLVVRVRDKAVPLFYLREWLAPFRPLTEEERGTGHVVLVHVGSRRVGFVVDDLIGREEVVIKPLGALLHGMPGFAGATITGNGRIALILDVPSLVKKHTHRF